MKNHPLSTISDGTNGKVNDDLIDSYIRGITKPIFDKVLQEKPINHTMVGKPHKRKASNPLYNPHNYRLYFLFSKVGFTPKEGMVGVWFGKLKNHQKEFTALGEGVRITVKRYQVEVINKLTDQEWFAINKADAKDEISKILFKIDRKCIESLKKFIEIYGGSCDYKIIGRDNRPDLILNTKFDNKVMNESYINHLPLNMTFETPIVKKVYKEPNIEFKEPISAARYLENSALNEFSPFLANELKAMKDTLNLFIPPVRVLKSQIHSVDDVFRFKSEISQLSQNDKEEIERHLFRL